jgi:transcription elongation factor GreA
MPHVTEPAPTTTLPRRIVVLGSRVRVRDTDGEHEYTMVARAMAGAPPGCVSTGSPVGRALLGRRLGDQVQVTTPGGVRLLTVADVAAPAPSSAADSARTCEA